MLTSSEIAPEKISLAEPSLDEYHEVVYVENNGEEPENYNIFKNIDTAKKFAIESLSELFEDTFDIKYMKKYLDLNPCYIVSEENRYGIAEDICFSSNSLDVFEIMKELGNDLYDTIERYSEFYIYENDEIPKDKKIIKIDYKKCAEQSIKKYGYIRELDTYYSNREHVLPGGYVAYPCG